ncbi:uncharacterized protein LOC110857668 [Folsomia candida]|uniref:Histone-lysine N-methyltransferase ATXR2 n=1 Tax=Folsomia candida TaxID=158441 RepID=A0A226DII8_FOLCA|nr:uncharacterized protein LOC110857668 [Folsomia candida]OXA44798.1 Histone-lysine N-methyltransferase ATXR2 [Folsomia candida]
MSVVENSKSRKKKGPKAKNPPPPVKLPETGVTIPQSSQELITIRHVTTRSIVISVMNRISRDAIDPETFAENLSERKWVELMVLGCSETHSTYDESMEVELKMENCVSIETLVKNVGQVLKGKFFLCRTITPSSKMVGLDAAVEDPEGKLAMRLAMFNYSVDAFMKKSDFEAVLPLGTMLIVKNPVFQKPYDKFAVLGLIVENPADVEILSPKRMRLLFPDVKWESDLPLESRALLKSLPFWEFSPDLSDLEIATKLKNVGNKGFVENRSTDAIRFYDLALEYLPDDGEEITPAETTLLVDILTNKAAALIKLECFNPALICTEEVLGMDDGHVKAIYRHAKALFGLRLYSACTEFLDEKLNQYPSLGEQSKDLLNLRCLSLAKSKKILPKLGEPPGIELIRALLRPAPRSFKKPQPQKDLPVGMVDRISEFRGPIVLQPSKIGEGDGLFATQDLEPGSILLVCKPFAAVFVTPKEKWTFTFNTTPHEYLVGVMANKIWLDPHLGRDLYTLWAGPELKILTDKDSNVTKVDIARIENIYAYNCIEDFEVTDPSNEDEFISCGVWIPSSKINHSCVDANVVCRHHDSGMVMMVTTFKKVKKGEEILMSYVDPLLPLCKRNFMESYGFTCKCRLCKKDRSECPVVIAKRRKLLESLSYNSITRVYTYNHDTLVRDLGTILEVERLRAATPELNYALANSKIFTIAAGVSVEKGLYTLCFHVLKKIYAVLKNVPTTYMHIDLMEAILVCCMRMKKEKSELEKWTQELRKYCCIYAGTLESVRGGFHPSIPEDLKKYGIEFFARGPN